MKKLHVLALSMLLSTSGMVMQANRLRDDNFDQEHSLDKQRNSNTYDGSLDSCEEDFQHDENRGVDDDYDKRHNLNKKRNSKTHPICHHMCNRVESKHPDCKAICTEVIVQSQQSRG